MPLAVFFFRPCVVFFGGRGLFSFQAEFMESAARTLVKVCRRGYDANAVKGVMVGM